MSTEARIKLCNLELLVNKGLAVNNTYDAYLFVQLLQQVAQTYVLRSCLESEHCGPVEKDSSVATL